MSLIKVSDRRALTERAKEYGFEEVPDADPNKIVYQDRAGKHVSLTKTGNERNKIRRVVKEFKMHAYRRKFANALPELEPAAFDETPRATEAPMIDHIRRNHTENVIAMPEPTKPVEVREPTTDQRVKIRSMLDKWFDDAVGMYLEDMSDQRIAEAVDVPRIIVERMREAAYGPIKITPEQAAYRAEINHLRGEMATLFNQVETLRGEMAKLATRINDLETRTERKIA